MVPEFLKDLVLGAEDAKSVTALSVWLQKRGYWFMSPEVVAAMCDLLKEQGIGVRHVPRAAELVVNPEPVPPPPPKLMTILKKCGAALAEQAESQRDPNARFPAH